MGRDGNPRHLGELNFKGTDVNLFAKLPRESRASLVPEQCVPRGIDGHRIVTSIYGRPQPRGSACVQVGPPLS